MDVTSWLAVNFLQLDRDKADVLVNGPEGQRERNVYQYYKISKYHNLGIIFYSDLSFISHIKNTTKRLFSY